MKDPHIDHSLSDLTFRERSRPVPARAEPTSHFWTGVAIFVGVALIHPFYSYQVQTRLAARDINAVVGEFSNQMNQMGEKAQRQVQESARESAAAALQRRQQGVRLMGTTSVGGNRVVIVDLGQATLGEAKATLCRQAAASFREPLAGERLRVQRHRGRQPAVDVGRITCD
jgi:hypothetical protein